MHRVAIRPHEAVGLRLRLMQENHPRTVAVHRIRAYAALVVALEEPLGHLGLPLELHPFQSLLVLRDFFELLIFEVLVVLFSFLPLDLLLLLLLLALGFDLFNVFKTLLGF